MARAPLLEKVIATTGHISSGAILTLDGKTQTNAEGLECVDDLLHMVASTILASSAVEKIEVGQVQAYMRRLIRRYGTVRRALEAGAQGRRRHALICPEKPTGWTEALTVRAAAIEHTLRRHAPIMHAVNAWLDEHGEEAEGMLTDYNAWLDSDLVGFEDDKQQLGPHATPLVRDRAIDGSDHNTRTLADFKKPLVTGSMRRIGDESKAQNDHERLQIPGTQMAIPADKFRKHTDPDLAYIWATVFEDKRPIEHPSDRVLAPLQEAAADRLNLDPDPYKRAVAAVARRDFGLADSFLPHLDNRMDAHTLNMLRGHRYDMEGRYDEALKQFEAAEPKPEDAAAQRAIAVALLRARRGSTKAHHAKAVETLRGLIALLDPTTTDAARSEAILGFAMLNAPTGKREDNVADAIAHLEKAIEGLDKEEFGPWWAETMHHLGVALLETRGTEFYAANVRRSIETFESAMSVWSRTTDPGHWATIQASMGAAWERLPEGDKRENLKRAVGCFELACSVRSRDAVPIGWARLQNALGTAWLQLAILGGEPEWVARAVKSSVAAHSGALEIWARDGRRNEWAHTQHALASAWMAMPTADADERRAILERSVEGYRLALEVRSKTKNPTEWAATQHSLAHALVQLGGETDVMLLREAIVCYENALTVRSKKRSVIDWARSEAGLAHAMTLIKVGDRNRHLSDAINRLNGVLAELKGERFARVRRPFEHWLEDAKSKLDENCGEVKLADGA